MFTLSAGVWYSDAERPEINKIANFSTKEAAQAYVDAVTLETYPNGTKRFRRDSLLSCKAWVDIEEMEAPLPFDPLPPETAPAKEYFVNIPNERFKISCSKLEYAEREMSMYPGSTLEERDI